ncbi:sensor histidine kinase [Salinibacterium sp. SWN1162]|uniref:sensor histidine kinase n=1 Tax=Salinibacterium sp. SWN1162 TaxID=2792053 RepID=UPI0018CE1BD2|nr:sensor histidine kinase [Salinibacterium sp. SWN1162]MBH0009043.1 sensor histidine kinase [Salinibacterium sp. SWN1162]
MTTDTVTKPRNPYWQLWRTTPKEVLYLMLGFPLAMTGFGVAISLVATGIGTLAVFLIGFFVMILALYVGRGFGLAHVNLLEWAGRAKIQRPDWQDDRAATGFGGWISATLGNAHYWLYLLHTLILSFVLTLITWTLSIGWLSVGLTGISAWFLDGEVQTGDPDWSLGAWFFGLFGVNTAGWNLEIADNIVAFIVGLIFIATLPFVTRGLVMTHWWLARALLSSFKSDGLRREVQSLEESRGAALSAEGHSLRRLERDIHDGPQQRLVRLQMDLAAAERQLDVDPEKARQLLSEARVQSAEALEELRALSRGFAPPLLLDRGLVAALDSVATRAAVPTTLTSELPEAFVLPGEVERASYFVVAELLTNVAKHAGAQHAEVQLSVEHAEDRSWLLVQVSDDGQGGAAVLADHGLAGIEERVRGVGGRLEIDSPAGGPTAVTARLPLPKTSAERAPVAL